MKQRILCYNRCGSYTAYTAGSPGDLALHTGAGLNSTEAFRHALRGSPDCRPQSGRHPQARAAPAGGGALAAALAQQ
ncbi:unnamed protein product [Prorocentrum cordatum]|uniref:Uncharacterized protein n=1 Tax=Prorocentrum cordatum TaxID=2364126 RepID=A0ABN9WQN3_9DINO|nr:unnamed protein product [Polarella glacialis]